jgi:hypothetical protein
MSPDEDLPPNGLLDALFALDQPPARDAAFTTAVMEQLMRRRFLEEVVVLLALSVAGGVVFSILWPALQPMLVALSQGFAPALAALAFGVCAWITLGGRLSAAPGAVS